MQISRWYLAFLLASERSIFTATKTGWSSGMSNKNSLFMNSCIPSASHRCTWGEQNAERRWGKVYLKLWENQLKLVEENTHLSKLALSQLLFEREQLSWELLHYNILPWQQVHSHCRDGIRVASSHALQVYNVCLGVVRDAILGYSRCGGFRSCSAGRSWNTM